MDHASPRSGWHPCWRPVAHRAGSKRCAREFSTEAQSCDRLRRTPASLGDMPIPRAASAELRPVRPAPEVPATRSASLPLEARREFGALLPLLDRPEIRDILIQVSSGVAQLWVDTGESLRHLARWQAPPEAIRRLAVGLIAAGGRHLDELHPMANVRLGEGIRVHAVLAPIAVAGATISIRLPRLHPLGFDELVRAGLATPAQERWLRRAVAERKNLLITGGTGSGKTTVLAALLELVPHTERIVTIEDVAELQVRHPHRVALETREANTEGAGEISLELLLREALRMRPDRLVLGECRGAEAVTLLTALNTGHDGGAGTLHANRLLDVPARLEALGMLAGLGPEPLGRQAMAAIHGVVHLERSPGGLHRITAIGSFELHAGALGIRDSPGSGAPAGGP